MIRFCSLEYLRRSSPTALKDEAHIWLARGRDLSQDERKRCQAVLPVEEQRRAENYRDLVSRDLFLTSRLLLRTALSLYTGHAPRSWQFETETGGRPRLARVHADLDLAFSLSHCEGLVAVLITGKLCGGIDVEATAHEVDLAAVAEHTLTAQERRWLADIPPEHRQARFIELWTLKEAYSKAIGQGLQMPFHRIGFSIAPTGRHTVAASIPGDPTATAWQFGLTAPLRTHRVAVALRSAGHRRDMLAAWTNPLEMAA